MRRTRLLLTNLPLTNFPRATNFPHTTNFPREAQLTESQLHYVKNVLRIDDGSELEVFDGHGQAYIAQLQLIGKKSAQLLLMQTLEPQAPPSLTIHLGLCISKPQHMDIALQKSAELGVGSITPIISTRGEHKRAQNKSSHWQEILVNACQQSGHNYLPNLFDPLPLLTWTHQLSSNTPKFICVPNQPMRLQTLSLQTLSLQTLSLQTLRLQNDASPQKASERHVIVLTGPEGGFTEDEITASLAAGFIATGLGPRILRTETAPLVAISLLHFIAGDLRPAP